MKITIVQGDITEQDGIDAITNAANCQLRGGSGICGSIFRAAGWGDLQNECWSDNHPIVHGHPEGKDVRVPTGQATFTNSYDIGCMFIIHAVGPVFGQYTPEEAERLLRSAYEQALQVAHAHGAKTIALPALSAGIYGYPVPEVARVAVEVAQGKYGAPFDEIRFVLFPDDVKAAFDAALVAVVS